MPLGPLQHFTIEPSDLERTTVIPGRCDSIEPSGALLRTENLDTVSNERKPISRFRVQGLRPCPGMTAVMAQ